MNKLFKKIAGVALGFSLAIGAGIGSKYLGNGFAETKAAATDGTAVTLFDSSNPYQASTTAKTTADGAITFKNSAGNKYSDPTRIYKSNKFTITLNTSVGSTINGVVFNCNNNEYGTALNDSTFKSNSGSLTKNFANPVLTIETTGVVSEISFTTSAQVRLNSIVVYYEALNVEKTYVTDLTLTGSGSMNVTSTQTLNVAVTPSNATNKTVEFVSSNPEIIAVDDAGVVSTISTGTATITATALGSETEGSVKKTLEITSSALDTYAHCDVVTPALTGLSVNSSYVEWTGKTPTNAEKSGATYGGSNSYQAGNALGVKSMNGISSLTSGGIAKRVVLLLAEAVDGATVNVYSSNSVIDLANTTGLSVKSADATKTVDITLDNPNRYVAIDASNKTINVKSAVIYWDVNTTPSIDLVGPNNCEVGSLLTYTATRLNSTDTIKWFVGDTEQTTGITVDGNTSTFKYTPTTVGTLVVKAQLSESVYATIEVTVITVEYFQKVTDLSQLTVGNKVLITATKDTDVYVAKKYASGGNNIKTVQTTLVDGKIKKTADMSAMTLSAYGDGYAFQDEGGLYLYAASTSSNHLKGSATAVPNARFTITTSGSSFSVKATNNTSRGAMAYNSSSNIFSCYASAGSYLPIDLYVLDTNPTVSEKLTTFGALYLRSSETPLVTAETGESGTDCLDTGKGYYAKAKAALADGSGVWASVRSALEADETGLGLRYRAWARAAGDLTPFDGKVPGAASNHMMNRAHNSYTTIIIVSSISASALIAVFFLLKKRKEQR